MTGTYSIFKIGDILSLDKTCHMIAFYISIVCRQQIIDNNMAARFPSHKFSNITIYSVQTYIYKPRQKNSLNINSLLFQSVHTCINILTKTKHFQEINSLYSLILQSVHTYTPTRTNLERGGLVREFVEQSRQLPLGVPQ